MVDALNGGYYGPGHEVTYDRMYVLDEKQEPDPEKRQAAREAAAQVLREQSERGEPLFANVNGHWVVAYPKGDELELVDLSGGTSYVSVNQFMDELNSLVFNGDVSRPPPWTQNDLWGKPGIGTGYKPGTTGGGR